MERPSPRWPNAGGSAIWATSPRCIANALVSPHQKPSGDDQTEESRMHELSLCRSIYRIVEDAAGGRPVEVIHVQVGKLRQVVPDTLRYCWEMMTEATPLEGSVLAVESMPVVVSCRRCV